MWFLENAWLVPLLPAVSFALILLFGKRFPRHGAEIGITAVGASFALSVGALIQWINRVDDAKGGSGVEGALRAFGQSVSRFTTAEHVTESVAPITRHTTWFQNSGVHLGVGYGIGIGVGASGHVALDLLPRSRAPGHRRPPGISALRLSAIPAERGQRRPRNVRATAERPAPAGPGGRE